MYKQANEGWIKHWDFILLDTLCLQISYVFAYFIRFGFDHFVYSEESYQNVGMWLALFSLSAAAIFNTMHKVLRRSLLEEIGKTLTQCFLVFAAITIFLFSIKDSASVSRIAMYVTMGIYVVLSFTTRMLYKHILIKHKLFGRKREMLVVAINETEASKAIENFLNRPEERINVCGLVLIDGSSSGEVNGIPVVSNIKGASDYICRENIDEVYILVSDYKSMPVELMENCAEMGVTVHQELFDKTGIYRRHEVERIAKRNTLTSSINIANSWQLLIKRIIDIVFGTILSLASLIVLLIVPPLIRKKSPGPVLLKQERIGLNGKKFRMYSIRTMYMDAEDRMQAWKKSHPDVKKVSIEEDPRFIGNENGKTGIGMKLRLLGLEDFPESFNVLLGQMSMVGTRAPSVEEWERYQYHHRARLATKPGITGLWQASGKSKTMSFEEATALDTEYIANWSLKLDWNILFKSASIGNTKS